MKKLQVGYYPWREDQEVGKEAARLFIRVEGLFFIKSDITRSDRDTLVLKEAGEKAVFQKWRRRSLFLAVLFSLMTLLSLLAAYIYASLSFFFLGLATLPAALYAFWHFRRGWSAQVLRHVLRPEPIKARETHGSQEDRELRYMIVNGNHIWDIRSWGLLRYPLAWLRGIHEDEEHFYLTIHGSSYHLICNRVGFIKGDAEAFRRFCRSHVQERAEEGVTDAGELFVDLADQFASDTPLFEHEQLVDLGRGTLRMIQKRDGFRSGEDAVCLAHFASQAGSRLGARRALPGGEYADFTFAEIGCGSGMISLLLTDMIADAQGWMLELVPRQAALARRNIRLNRLEDRLTALACDVRVCAQEGQDKGGEGSLPGSLRGQMDMVVVNPPYRPLPLPHGLSDDPLELEKQVARFCLTLSCQDLARSASALLREDGYCCLLYPLRQEEELLEAMHKEHLSLARKRAIVSQAGRAAGQALYAFIYSQTLEGAAAEYPDLLMRDENGQYTSEAKAYYDGQNRMQEAELLADLREPTEAELAAERALEQALLRVDIQKTGEGS